MYSDIFLSIAAEKGLADIDKVMEYINPRYESHLHSPDNIADIGKAIELIHNAIINNIKIAIYADYDCDGIPGATILSELFDKIKYNNYIVYIPHRHNEGYGIHKAAIDKLLEQGVGLMVTIDLGITNVKEIAYARERGLQVLLTDHHLPIRDEGGQQIIPPANAIINMKRDDCQYEDKHLCGCATIWKVIKAFLDQHGEEYQVEKGWEKTLLDMVGLSTVADMVPLHGENRVLAHFGLKVLNMTRRPGLLHILSNTKSIGASDEETIGYTIAPRLNSASRMAEPIIAYQALYDKSNGQYYAKQLEKLNEARKSEVKDSLKDIQLEHLDDAIIVIHNPDWNPGVLGLIASKVVEDSGKTVFVAGGRDENGIYKGSVRAGHQKVNTVQLMSEVTEFLIHYGGHEAAGGFQIHERHIEDFRKALNERHFSRATEEVLDEDEAKTMGRPILSQELSKSLYQELKLLGPFGAGNTAPAFAPTDTYVYKSFGKNGEHLELNYIKSKFRAIMFYYKDSDLQNSKAGRIPTVNLSWDSYRNDIVGRIIGWE